MKLFILAGGFATRLWPITENRAKPLLQVGEHTVLEWLLQKVPQTTPTTILTNQRFASAFEKVLENFPSAKLWIEDSYSDQQKLGALGALSKCLQENPVDESIQVWAGDNLLPQLQWDDLAVADDEACVLSQDLKDREAAKAFGVIESNKQGKVVAFREKPQEPASSLVSTGFFGLGKNLLPLVHEAAQEQADALGNMFPLFLKKGVAVRHHTVSGNWFDVGSFETYLEAHRTLQSQPVINHSTAKCRDNVYQGKVWIGEGCVVENSQLIDCVISPGTVVRNCHLARCIVDENCRLQGLDLCQKLIRQKTHLSSE